MITKQWGRLLFAVASQSRRDRHNGVDMGPLWHMVDLEPIDDDGIPATGDGIARCTCEAYFFHVSRPCKHILAVADELAPAMKIAAAWRKSPAKASTSKPKRAYTLNNETRFTAKK